ncbi:chromate efflux transporter [Telmatospirillum siberiense]|uniref:Chromate transporter n=1 Tax=Telmatospirillum siberiense TaxID=382514 RepID=A0A2N3Q1Z4_9PROT|nr:chromate efflux transporter [Telmatospirillum siberiense]PKU26669.1 chromate transporter [Telmatospirillum siberiense]
MPEYSIGVEGGRAGIFQRVCSVFLVFLRLGLTSFGGPVAHLGYFREEFVRRRMWLDEAAYADIVALCQFLPGPASSQVGICIGLQRAGLAGSLAAWLGFTLPSALVLWAFACGIDALGDLRQATWLHGLKIVAVSVVAQAVWGMARSLCPDRLRISLAVGAALLSLIAPTVIGQIGAMVLGGAVGLMGLPRPPARDDGSALPKVPPALACSALILFVALLALLPVVAAGTGSQTWRLIDGFFRSGSLVFGGGHVVLPLLRAEVVQPGWIEGDVFLAGYGAAQAVPGPLFTFAAYLGAAMKPAPHGWLGSVICLGAIFLPSFLLVIGVLPFWDRLRRKVWARAALQGVNAAVVGVLLAALYSPVWTSAIFAPADFGLALVAFLLLVFWRLPPWLVVIMGALATA